MKGNLLFEQDQKLDIALKSFKSARQSSCLSIFFFMKGGFSSVCYLFSLLLILLFFFMVIDINRVVYEELGKYGDLENQVLCRERVEELEPHIRYCSHKIGESNLQASELAHIGEIEGPALDLFKSKLEVGYQLRMTYYG